MVKKIHGFSLENTSDTVLEGDIVKTLIELEEQYQFMICCCFCNRLPRWYECKESTCQCRRCKRHRFSLWVGKTSCSRKWQPTPVLLPGKCQGQEKPGGHTVHGATESWTWLSTTFCNIQIINKGILKICFNIYRC